MNLETIENLTREYEELDRGFNVCLESLDKLQELKNGDGSDLHKGILDISLALSNALGSAGVNKVSLPTMEDYSAFRLQSFHVATEGIFSAIGDFFKKIWEWIKKFFKAIKDFFFGKTKELEEMKEEVYQLESLFINACREAELKSPEDIQKFLDDNNLISRSDKYGAIAYLYRRVMGNGSSVDFGFQYSLNILKGYLDPLDAALNEAISSKTFSKEFLDKYLEFIKARSGEAKFMELLKYYKIAVLAEVCRINFRIVEKLPPVSNQVSAIIKDCLQSELPDNPNIGDVDKEWKALEECLGVTLNGVPQHILFELASGKELVYFTKMAYGSEIKSILSQMPKANEPQKVFDFLDQDGSGGEKRKLLTSFMLNKFSTFLFTFTRCGYKVKDKEKDAIKTFFYNKDNIIKFLMTYFLQVKRIDINAYKQANDKFAEIEKKISRIVEESDRGIKSHQGWLTNLVSNRAQDFINIKGYMDCVMQELKDLILISMSDVNFLTKVASPYNLKGMIAMMFKDESIRAALNKYGGKHAMSDEGDKLTMVSGGQEQPQGENNEPKKEGETTAESYFKPNAKSNLTFLTSNKQKQEPTKPKERLVVDFRKIL